MDQKRKKDLDFEAQPFWYKDAVIYQVHVKAFCDSDGDGVGDFNGLTSKLDYLQDLGVTAIWLLPFSPSPMKDDGYDIADYAGIHSGYGTLGDFKIFLRKAHDRGLYVITELVVNHTSDQHPWFQKARRAKPGRWWRDFYVWSDTPDRYKEARIIFQDFESSNWSWDSQAKAYYWHRFYSHQPDLNYDNPQVQNAILKILDHWLGMGVDGLRIDAVPYLYEREGTDCENLAETHAFLRKMRAHVDGKFENRMLLGEANQWPEDAAAYFGKGNECHMAFHFPLMPRMFMAIRMEDRFPIVDILTQTPSIPELCQWAIFLRNHDELTLEMVTDEERDYMYRVYAQDPRARINLGIKRRLAPLLGNNRRRIELMSSLLCSMPGTPVLYYGDEIGMGDNVYLGDRNGVRTPMQWSADRNAGFSRGNPQKLYLPVITDPEYHYETINVEAQQANRQSLLWWMKRLIALRKRFKAFCRGSIEFLDPENYKILAFIRRYEEEEVLVVANLSRFVQYVELDLSSRAGQVPVEIFGRSFFPPIGKGLYPLSLGPHGFFWFSLEQQGKGRMVPTVEKEDLPVILVSGEGKLPFDRETKMLVERALPAYLMKTRWFRAKGRSIKSVGFGEYLSVNHEILLSVVQVDYAEGDGESYLLPLMLVEGKGERSLLNEYPWAAIARLRDQEKGTEAVLCDAIVDRAAAEALLYFMVRGRKTRAARGEIVGTITKAFNRFQGESLEPSVMKAEQTNTSVVFGKQFVLKLIRRLEEGINPDLEIGRFLTERCCDFAPPLAGAVEYRRAGTEPVTLAILQKFVPNQGDAWYYTLDVLKTYFERVTVERAETRALPLPESTLASSPQGDVPSAVYELIGHYLESARLLGQRTGKLHVLLSSEKKNPHFRPEAFSSLYQRGLYQSMRTLTGRVFQLLRKKIKSVPEAVASEAVRILELEKTILDRLRIVTERKITAQRIRCHGDLHLGQFLYTGNDFVIIDFEGEPGRPLSERKIKRSPLRDVSGMIRSFDYAVNSALFDQEAHGIISPDDMPYLEWCANLWKAWVGRVYLEAYLNATSQSEFLPRTREETGLLLNVYLLEKAVYELGYELNNRPEWLKIPLRGIVQLLE
ncbi:MAG: maltose alpha-D-glucosyltransferase [Deltaproteobacteria bacterium]|nr:maltose alpha-D-glucosyltransferase [Deltaproteobacteria bacterium]